jgi:hypothetical protein
MLQSLLWVSTLATIACADGVAVPTSPSATTAASSALAEASSSSRLATLEVTKTCDPVQPVCTVQSASPGSPIPVGTVANYTGPYLDKRTSSAVVLETSDGSTATGHCTLNHVTGLGRCVFTSGTGVLAGFHANLEVTSNFAADPVTYTWRGTYHFVGN